MKDSGEGAGRVSLDQRGTEAGRLRLACEAGGSSHPGGAPSRTLAGSSGLQMPLLGHNEYP